MRRLSLWAFAAFLVAAAGPDPTLAKDGPNPITCSSCHGFRAALEIGSPVTPSCTNGSHGCGGP